MWFTVKWKLATVRKVGLFWSVKLIIIQKVKTWTVSLNFAISYLPSETAEKSQYNGTVLFLKLLLQIVTLN